MQGRLRVDVVERERILVLVNRLRRQFAAQDAREDIAVVIGKRRVDRHGESSYCRRPAFSVWPEVPRRRASSVAMSSADRDRVSTRLNSSHYCAYSMAVSGVKNLTFVESHYIS